jgi:hypothetical protein
MSMKSVSIGMWLDERIKIWVDGIVISSHPSTGMGVKFLGLNRHNLDLFERYMKKLDQAETTPVRLWLPTTKDK